MKGDKQPRWIIADEWAVDTDPYNWILYHRAKGIKRWRTAGFYPSSNMLLEDLRQKIERKTKAKDMPTAINAALEASEAAAGRFSAYLKQHVWSELNRPPARGAG